MLDFYDILGLFGVSISMTNYARLQWQRDYAKHMAFSLGNLLGSLLIVLSLLNKWNLSAFIVNCIVATISAYGVYRCLKYKVKAAQSRVECAQQP
ncbi:MAG: hypothetical protein PHD48_07225 [Alphaproteobacteria bacterium]|nr:hypothetical protein [Alphaproteobacteria bacterium]